MDEPNLIKKDNIIISDGALKKQKRLLIIAVIGVVFLFLGSSYALLTNFDDTNTVMTISTGNLSMAINDSTSLVTLSDKIPETEVSGLANSTPVPLVLTNTSEVGLAKYVVKLIADPNQTSDLLPQYIRYAVSTDGGNTYGKSLLLSESNILYVGYNLADDASKTLYFKMWIDENAGSSATDKSFYGSIAVDLYQEGTEINDVSVVLKNAIETRENEESCVNYVEDIDGVIYFSGSNTGTCAVDNNYVWYSGKMWRVTAVYPDGKVKMITENGMTAMHFGTTAAYANSWMKQWGEEELLPTLYNYQEIIDTNYSWNATKDSVAVSADLTTPPTKPAETTMVVGPVGGLNSYEYYQATRNGSTSDNYLWNEFWFYLINPAYDATKEHFIGGNGQLQDDVPTSNPQNMRYAVVLKTTTMFRGGEGTKSNPYTIEGDIGAPASGTLLNTRVVGEYITPSTTRGAYRIVGISSNNTTKIVLTSSHQWDSTSNDGNYFASTKYYNASGNTRNNRYADYNISVNHVQYFQDNVNDFYKLFVNGTYYLGTYTAANGYKSAICSDPTTSDTMKDCAKVSRTWTGKGGLLRMGEFFVGQHPVSDGCTSGNGCITKNIWTISPGSSGVWRLDTSGKGYDQANYASFTAYFRYTFDLDASTKIVSGSGTYEDPFVLTK